MSKIRVKSIEATKTKEVNMKRRLLLPVSLGLVMVLAIMGLCGCGSSNAGNTNPEESPSFEPRGLAWEASTLPLSYTRLG